MRIFQALALLLAVTLLTGCQNALKTMGAHITIDNKTAHDIATANAGVNVCLADKSIDRARAFEFSTRAAQFLDLVVFDESYYKQVYEAQLTAIAGTKPSQCDSLDRALPTMTARLNETYVRFAAELGRARTEENRQIAQMLSSYRTGGHAGVYPQVTFPPLQFRQEQPATQSYLVNTRGGLVQCKVTNNSYVFCL